MSIRDFIILSKQESARLEQSLQNACDQWAEKWLSHSDVSISSEVINVCGDEDKNLSQTNWAQTRLGQYKIVKNEESQDTSSLVSVLLPALDAAKIGTEMDVDLAADALNDLIENALGAKLADSNNNEAKVTKNGLLGHCFWHVNIKDFNLTMSLPSDLVHEIVQRKTKKGPKISVDLDQLIANRNISLTVKLEKFKTSLGLLRDLKVGDILETGLSLDKPLALTSESDTPLAQCYIGKVQSNKAIVLSGKN